MSEPLSLAMATLGVLVGILISLVLPVCVNILRRATTGLETRGRRTLWQRIAAAWNQYGGNRYLITFVAAVVVAVVVVLLLGLQFYTFRDAAFAGFAWESLINKVFAVQQPAGDGDGND